MPLPRGVHLAALAIHTNPTGQTLFMACSDSKIRRIPMVRCDFLVDWWLMGDALFCLAEHANS